MYNLTVVLEETADIYPYLPKEEWENLDSKDKR